MTPRRSPEGDNGSDPDLLAEQAVDEAASDADTEDDEKRCQTWLRSDHCLPSAPA